MSACNGVRIETLADGAVSEIHVGLKGTMSALFLKEKCREPSSNPDDAVEDRAFRSRCRRFVDSAAVDAGAQTAQSYQYAPQQASATLENYRFRNGETLSELRLNYATLGQPRRNSHGAIDNAALDLRQRSGFADAAVSDSAICAGRALRCHPIFRDPARCCRPRSVEQAE